MGASAGTSIEALGNLLAPFIWKEWPVAVEEAMHPILAVDSASDDVAQVRQLYDETAVALRRALSRLTWPECDVDDLLQEVFVVALRRSGALLAAESPRGWLYGVAVKVAAGARARHRVRNFFGLGEAAEVAQDDGPFESVERAEAAKRVQRALSRLSAIRREALVLYELEGLSGQEIAAALRIPLKTVWTRLHHARRDFEEGLRRENWV